MALASIDGRFQDVEKRRITITPQTRPRQVRNLASVRPSIRSCQHPTHADTHTGIRKASEQTILAVIVDIPEVLVLQA